jgi:hypothetical protein
MIISGPVEGESDLMQADYTHKCFRAGDFEQPLYANLRFNFCAWVPIKSGEFSVH